MTMRWSRFIHDGLYEVHTDKPFKVRYYWHGDILDNKHLVMELALMNLLEDINGKLKEAIGTNTDTTTPPVSYLIDTTSISLFEDSTMKLKIRDPNLLNLLSTFFDIDDDTVTIKVYKEEDNKFVSIVRKYIEVESKKRRLVY